MTIPHTIKEAIKNNRLVIFVGSGLSSKFNLPSWAKLVEEVINNSNIESYKSFLPLLESGLMKPIEILDKLNSEHNEIKRYIFKNFNITNGDFSLHKDIINLSGQIITTNYDNAFEKASNNLINPAIYTSDFNISEINKNSEPYIFKLHGSYSEPDHCIIFNNDYENLYLKDTSARQKLKSIFTEKVILFIGFSFNDPDINLIFNNLDKSFSNNNKHFILTKEPKEFEKYKFLEPIPILEYSDINSFIKDCLEYKSSKIIPIENDSNLEKVLKKEIKNLKIALLYPNPLDIEIKDELSRVINSFDSLDIIIFVGTLNLKTLLIIEDYDILIVVSKVFKTNLYIEEDNLKSGFLSPEEICLNIPNDSIPVIFITNEKISNFNSHPNINVSSFKNAILNRFVYKAFRDNKLDFNDESIAISLDKLFSCKIEKGTTKYTSIYNNNKNLEIGKKCLTNVIGRIEEQSAIALKLISIKKSNKLLNIKASGGTGKTTLIKKVSYELYNRGFYKDGVTFESCESVKSFLDFEEILINSFHLNNILNFKEYLLENYSSSKIDLLIILDNFETVVNTLKKEEFNEVIELLKFVTDYANIVVTSREKFSNFEDFEDVYSLTPLITDDSLKLFQEHYGLVNNDDEIRILRTEILEDLLNNNPLAIKLVTKSRTRYNHISELKQQLTKHFFESINEDYSLVFKNSADLNIERTKSIYQSINYSYTTLNNKEKIAFELLSLFPDGISLSNFKKCFEKSSSTNKISDKELRILRDKSLIEDYNGTIQLQPIIRRFAEFQFSKISKEIKQKYCLDAYIFNCYIVDIIEFIEKKKSLSEALKLYSQYKNNLLNVLSYMPDIEIIDNGRVPKKNVLLNYLYIINDYILNEKQIEEFEDKLPELKRYFSDLENAEIFINVLGLIKTYYHSEFDYSYSKLSKILSVEEMNKRLLSNEDYIEERYKNMISNIHSMEGFTYQYINLFINNNDATYYLDSNFFYLGITNNISRKKDGFYFFEYEFMFNRLNIEKLEKYIDSLYLDEHLEIMQCTYTLSKSKDLDKKIIQKLVVTNPYTKGLKELMLAFNSKTNLEKIKHFEKALSNLFHIKYYYLESLYYYCLFLKNSDYIDYKIKLKEGLELSQKSYYQYLNFLFSNIENETKPEYNFSYSYYPINTLETFVKQHNENWEKHFKENILSY